MAFYITSKCTACEACVQPCPTGSIFYGDGIYVIDSDTCGECEICVTLCPENAIQKLILDDEPDTNPQAAGPEKAKTEAGTDEASDLMKEILGDLATPQEFKRKK